MLITSKSLDVQYTFIFPRTREKTMDPADMKGIFVGYSNSSKAYRIYIKEQCRIEVSRDVIFNENQAYKESKDIPIDHNDEEVPIFEEEFHHDNSITNVEKGGPSEPIQSVVIRTTRKRSNSLKAMLHI